MARLENGTWESRGPMCPQAAGHLGSHLGGNAQLSSLYALPWGSGTGDTSRTATLLPVPGLHPPPAHPDGAGVFLLRRAAGLKWRLRPQIVPRGPCWVSPLPPGPTSSSSPWPCGLPWVQGPLPACRAWACGSSCSRRDEGRQITANILPDTCSWGPEGQQSYREQLPVPSSQAGDGLPGLCEATPALLPKTMAAHSWLRAQPLFLSLHHVHKEHFPLPCSSPSTHSPWSHPG